MNNIEIIDSFLEDNTNTTLILPKLNGEVVIFYEMLIQIISKKKNFIFRKIENFKNFDELITPSLFADRYTYIIDTAITKNTIERLLKIEDKSLKFFLFSDYASYKKNLLNSIRLNAYDFKKDMSSFLAKDQDFNSLEERTKNNFLSFSYNNPHLFFSELQKSIIQTLVLGTLEGQEVNTIASIRREIFRHKDKFSIKLLPEFYSLLKKEVKIKKFNF